MYGVSQRYQKLLNMLWVLNLALQNRWLAKEKKWRTVQIDTFNDIIGSVSFLHRVSISVTVPTLFAHSSGHCRNFPWCIQLSKVLLVIHVLLEEECHLLHPFGFHGIDVTMGPADGFECI